MPNLLTSYNEFYKLVCNKNCSDHRTIQSFDEFCSQLRLWNKVNRKRVIDHLATRNDERAEKRIDIMKALYEMFVTNVDHTVKEIWEIRYKASIDMLKKRIPVSLIIKGTCPDGTTIISGSGGTYSRRIIRNIYLESLSNITRLKTDENQSLGNPTNTGDYYSVLRCVQNLIQYQLMHHCILLPCNYKKILSKDIKLFMNTVIGRATMLPSIFNPTTCVSIFEKIMKPLCQQTEWTGRIFTPVMGWSSYLLAFLNSPSYKHYVGTDVITEVVDKSRTLLDFFGTKTGKIYHCPSEDLDKNHAFISSYPNYFDTVFFSPPYFKLERYDSDNQSSDVYPTLDLWFDGYWRPTIKLVYETLKPGGVMCYVVNDYKDENGNLVRLNKPMKEICYQEGFRDVGNDQRYCIAWGNINHSSSTKRQTGKNYEPVTLLRKPKPVVK